MSNIFKIIIYGILVLFTNNILPANSKPIQSIFDEMSYTEMIDVTLEVDMDALTADIRSAEKHKAVLSFVDRHGLDQTWDITVNLRGKFRRMRCPEIPPLKINFLKTDLEAAGLDTFDDLKLVTHCVEDKTIAKELLLKEFLAYKLYNQITDESFRVQFLKITYQDIKTGRKKKQWAFLIEDTAQLRARLAAKKCKEPLGLSSDKFDGNQIKTMALFQYMIGNADWNLHTARNVKMIIKDDKILAIPYDFDFSGMVNAPYALANSNVGQKQITERIYLGFDIDQESLQESLKLFIEKRGEILNYIKNFKELKSFARKDVLKYVESFFDHSDDIYFEKEALETIAVDATK